MIPANILVVEDERIVALDLKEQLERIGYQVVAVVSTADAAVAEAGALRPDLVIMDIHLEGEEDGTEAARRIYAQWRLPIVFLTAYSEDATLERAQGSVPFGYLIKPVDFRELHTTIQVVLNRRLAEQAVERSEERLRLALDAAEMGIWEWEADTGQVVSGGSYDILMGGIADPINEPFDAFRERVHPADRAAVEQALQQALREGGAVNVSFRYVKPSGRIGWIEAHAKAHTKNDGVSRLIGVIRDISERRQLEERLKQAGTVFETAAEAIVIIDADHHIVSVNPAFSSITGHAAEAVLGLDPDEFLHARRHSDQFYPRLESSGGVWQGETYCRRANGEVFPVWENVSVVTDTSGTVSHYVTTFSDITVLRRAEQELKHLAHNDPLTGLPNRLLFNDRLDQALETARRSGQHCALLFLDLDDFKVINDTLGHSSGDLLLQTLAGRIKTRLRRSDTAARLGGDEFVVIMTDIARGEDSSYLANKILQAISEPFDLAGERLSISGSIGISIYPGDGDDRNSLLRAADTAMYHAKTQGRNRFCFYTEELAKRAAERMNVEQGLKRGLKQGEFLLHYQPMVNLDDNAISGFEALVRWQHPSEGLVSPLRFIPIAEETGLIQPLGDWVLNAACNEWVQWSRHSAVPIRLCVNVSARQLVRDHFENSVRRALEETGFPAERLEIEITESTLQVIEQSLDLLGRLKNLGVQIAIDDFGTGYSSLSVLKHLPIDRLKIDRSFVSDMAHDPNDAAIVEAIVSMSRTLGLKTTAEGIETPEQLKLLQRIGCDDGQGYWFSRPLPGDAMLEFLNAGGR